MFLLSPCSWTPTIIHVARMINDAIENTDHLIHPFDRMYQQAFTIFTWHDTKYASEQTRDIHILADRGFNTLRPRKNGRHFADDILKCIFVNKNVWISLKFVPKVRINNIPALVQIVAWRRPGDKPLSEAMLYRFTDAYIRHQGEMS